MTQDHYRQSISYLEILREAGEVKGHISTASVTTEGEDIQKIIEKSIEVGVRLCGFEIGYSEVPDGSINSNNELVETVEGLHE
jgi:hypothetical protein